MAKLFTLDRGDSITGTEEYIEPARENARPATPEERAGESAASGVRLRRGDLLA